jgi:hypothetical protein
LISSLITIYTRRHGILYSAKDHRLASNARMPTTSTSLPLPAGGTFAVSSGERERKRAWSVDSEDMTWGVKIASGDTISRRRKFDKRSDVVVSCCISSSRQNPSNTSLSAVVAQSKRACKNEAHTEI